MRFRESLAIISEFTPKQFEDVRRNINPDWIVCALQATGTATIRRRRLPAELVVWLIIGMALMRNRSIHDVVSKLKLVLPGYCSTVVPSSTAEARVRLGADPMQWLFATCADHWAHTSAADHRWQGLALYGVDGSTLRVPDSPGNAQEFGYTKSCRGESGYPTIRLAALMALRSHLLASVNFGPYKNGEYTYAADLWMAVPDHSLVIVDKNFFAARILIPLAHHGSNRHWLIRAKAGLCWKVIRILGPNDQLVEMQVSRKGRAQDPTLPKTWVARAITYRRKGFRPQTLLTSLLDSALYPCTEVATLYHERWELELGYDEIKTEMLDREEAIRSKTPQGVKQELWGVFLAYNLVRLEMERVAQEAGVEPTQISFVTALRFICDEWLWCAIASPGAIPKHLRALRAELATFILPIRRSERSYPRAVKIKMSNYPKKRRQLPVETHKNG